MRLSLADRVRRRYICTFKGSWEGRNGIWCLNENKIYLKKNYQNSCHFPIEKKIKIKEGIGEITIDAVVTQWKKMGLHKLLLYMEKVLVNTHGLTSASQIKIKQ